MGMDACMHAWPAVSIEIDQSTLEASNGFTPITADCVWWCVWLGGCRVAVAAAVATSSHSRRLPLSPSYLFAKAAAYAVSGARGRPPVHVGIDEIHILADSYRSTLDRWIFQSDRLGDGSGRLAPSGSQQEQEEQHTSKSSSRQQQPWPRRNRVRTCLPFCLPACMYAPTIVSLPPTQPRYANLITHPSRHQMLFGTQSCTHAPGPCLTFPLTAHTPCPRSPLPNYMHLDTLISR